MTYEPSKHKHQMALYMIIMIKRESGSPLVNEDIPESVDKGVLGWVVIVTMGLLQMISLILEVYYASEDPVVY